MFIAPDINNFQHLFIQRLKDMLDDDGLGAFILVLANSMQDQTLSKALESDINLAFSRLSANTPRNPPIDDDTVFTQIQKMGIHAFTCWETRVIEEWELIYNPIRALRPSRSSGQKIEQLHQPFAADKFHFNKPFLKPEILWEGVWQHTPLRVLYNKFPFAPWHILIAFEPEKQHPQYLLADAHHTMSALINESQHLPGFGITYNSLGAFASINQLHFQGFIRSEPLPIENKHWQHNGGSKPYPLKAQCYDNPAQAWEAITLLHKDNQPFNLLYRANTCYVIPQKGQDIKLADWVTGAGWQEACGIFTLIDKTKVGQLNNQDIAQQLLSLQT